MRTIPIELLDNMDNVDDETTPGGRHADGSVGVHET